MHLFHPQTAYIHLRPLRRWRHRGLRPVQPALLGRRRATVQQIGYFLPAAAHALIQPRQFAQRGDHFLARPVGGAYGADQRPILVSLPGWGCGDCDAKTWLGVWAIAGLECNGAFSTTGPDRDGT